MPSSSAPSPPHLPGVLPQLHWHCQLWCDGGLQPIPPLYLQHWDGPAQIQHLLHGWCEPTPRWPKDLYTHSSWVHTHQYDQPHHFPGKCQTWRGSICWTERITAQSPAPTPNPPPMRNQKAAVTLAQNHTACSSCLTWDWHSNLKAYVLPLFRGLVKIEDAPLVTFVHFHRCLYSNEPNKTTSAALYFNFAQRSMNQMFSSERSFYL